MVFVHFVYFDGVRNKANVIRTQLEQIAYGKTIRIPLVSRYVVSCMFPVDNDTEMRLCIPGDQWYLLPHPLNPTTNLPTLLTHSISFPNLPLNQPPLQPTPLPSLTLHLVWVVSAVVVAVAAVLYVHARPVSALELAGWCTPHCGYRMNNVSTWWILRELGGYCGY